jgi:hypothetical protein
MGGEDERKTQEHYLKGSDARGPSDAVGNGRVVFYGDAGPYRKYKSPERILKTR